MAKQYAYHRLFFLTKCEPRYAYKRNANVK